MRLHLPNKDSVRSSTDPHINWEIDRRIEESIRKYTYQGSYEISERIRELEEEWDINKVMELNSAALALLGIGLSFKNKSWLILSGVALGSLAYFATRGWGPPVPFLRRFGFRTKQEIDCEIYALKYLRGDFNEFQPAGKRDADNAIKEAMIAVGAIGG